MAFCRNCGAELIDGEAKCSNCDFQKVSANVDVKQEPIKASTGQMVAMWIFCALGGLIGIILSLNIISAKYPDKTPKYIESSRNQAKVGLVISVIWMAIALFTRFSQ